MICTFPKVVLMRRRAGVQEPCCTLRGPLETFLQVVPYVELSPVLFVALPSLHITLYDRHVVLHAPHVLHPACHRPRGTFRRSDSERRLSQRRRRPRNLESEPVNGLGRR